MEEQCVVASVLTAAFPGKPLKPRRGPPPSLGAWRLSQEAALWALGAMCSSDAGFAFLVALRREVKATSK